MMTSAHAMLPVMMPWLIIAMRPAWGAGSDSPPMPPVAA